jgi:RNA polymerase sigma-70 factor (ECF subfamily)
MKRPPDEDRRDAPSTLGDVLYADKSKARVSESEWVQLVESMAAGDQRALQAIYERIHKIVYTLSVRITGNRETAEEVTLDVFHDVWRRASSYDPAGGSVVGWIMNQARSRAIDRLRFEQRKKRVDSQEKAPSPTNEPQEPQENLRVEDRRRLLNDALTTLAPAERRAIETTFFSDLTHMEAAKKLDEPLGTLKTRVRSGLVKLRRALAGEGNP